MGFNQTSNIQLQDRDEHEYKYLLTTDPGNAVSNLIIRSAKEGSFLETKLTILTPVVGDIAPGSYIAERPTVLFQGRKFVYNREDFWTYIDGIIGFGLTPAELVDFFNPIRGGYYNFTEVLTYNSANVAADIVAKHIDLDPFLYANQPIFDYGVSYV